MTPQNIAALGVRLNERAGDNPQDSFVFWERRKDSANISLAKCLCLSEFALST